MQRYETKCGSNPTPDSPETRRIAGITLRRGRGGADSDLHCTEKKAGRGWRDKQRRERGRLEPEGKKKVGTALDPSDLIIDRLKGERRNYPSPIE